MARGSRPIWFDVTCPHPSPLDSGSELRSRQLLLHCSTFAHPWARTSSIPAIAPALLYLPPSMAVAGVVPGGEGMKATSRAPGVACTQYGNYHSQNGNEEKD